MPKVSFYLRNEDVPKWQAITKKTEFIHAALNDTAPEVIQAAVIFGEEMAKHNMRQPRPVSIDNPTISFCKHDNVLGFCKKGCR